jgi:hypothetical protein
LAAGPVKWTERWIARAQRKADLRAERFVRHEAGVRAGTEAPGFLDRLESWIVFRTERFIGWGSLSAAYKNERSISRNWPRAVRSDGAALAEEWRTWVAGGPVRGPDGVMVVIGVKFGGEDLPFDDLPDRAPVTRLEFAESRKVYSVCARQPSGRVWGFRSFATETSARWYAVELARTVRQVGVTGLQRSAVLPERRRSARSDRVLAEQILGVRISPPGLPQRARARWRRIRTGGL